VITGPEGAAVAVDGKPVGTLPTIPPVRVAEGTTVVTASGSGFEGFSKTIQVAGGAKISIAIVFDPIEKGRAVARAAPAPQPGSVAPALAVADHRRPAWRTWTGAGLATAGTGLLAWGIVWIAIDGNDRCAAGGPACATVYDTKTAGWILAVGGAAAVTGGAIVLLTGRRDDGQNGGDVVLAATPTSLLLRGRF
jgi:hypothetical protein